MCSEKQLLANRQNALKSTGPTTPAGKSRSAQNALKHGMCCASVLPTEDQWAYNMFCDEMKDSLQSKSPAESMLAERITQLTWRLRRLPAAEAEIFNQLQPQDLNPQNAQTHEPLTSAEQLALCFIHRDDRTNPFTRLQRYEAHLQRSLTHCYKQLRALQEYREAHPRTYDPEEWAPPPGHEDAIPSDLPDPQSSTTDNEPQTTNELPNEPDSPPSIASLAPSPGTPGEDGGEGSPLSFAPQKGVHDGELLAPAIIPPSIILPNVHPPTNPGKCCGSPPCGTTGRCGESLQAGAGG